jgi:hypothetical protein
MGSVAAINKPPLIKRILSHIGAWGPLHDSERHRIKKSAKGLPDPAYLPPYP